MRASCMLPALALLGGCQTSEISSFALPARDYFFLVSLDAASQITRISAPYGARAGALAFGGPTSVAIEESDRVLVVALDRASLTALHRGFDTSRERELTLTAVPPPVAPRLYDTQRPRLDARLPDDTTIEEATLMLGAEARATVAAALREGLTLTVPVDPDSCRLPREIELRPFGDVEQLLPVGRPLPFSSTDPLKDSGWHDILDIEHVDRDRAVFITGESVGVIERGRPIAPAVASTLPTHLIPIAHATGAPIELSRMALSPASDSGERRVFIAGARANHPAVFELVLSDAGLLFTGTSTLDPDVAALELTLEDVRVDAAGNTIAVGPSDALLYRAAGAPAFRRMRPVQASVPAELRRVILTGDPRRPHLLAEDLGHLFLGDVARGEWSPFRRRDRLNDRRFYGLAATPSADDLWAVGPKGTVFRNPDRAGWAPVTVVPPPDFAPCASAAAPQGWPLLTETMQDVHVDASAAYLLVGDCTALLRVRRDDLCAAVLPIRGRRVELIDSGYHALHALGGQLLMAGAHGAVLVVDLSGVP